VGEVERFSFEGYERYRIHPDGEWVRYSDYSDAQMRAFYAIEGECEKARRKGAEEERERLRERFLDELEKARQGHVRPGSVEGELFGNLQAKDHAAATLAERRINGVKVVALADVNAAIAAVFDTPALQEADGG
jgi:hypothetical protein